MQLLNIPSPLNLEIHKIDCMMIDIDFRNVDLHFFQRLWQLFYCSNKVIRESMDGTFQNVDD